MNHEHAVMKRRLFNLIFILVAVMGTVFLLMLLSGGMKLYRIPTRGMSPTVMPGDLVFSTGAFLTFSDFKRGQILVFRPPVSPKNRYIQRVVALPGDRLEVIDGVLAVNGVVLKSPEGSTSVPPKTAYEVPGMKVPKYPLTVPEGHLFLMGDNYSNSLDSRYFGPVSAKEVTHVPRSIVHPPNRAGRLK